MDVFRIISDVIYIKIKIIRFIFVWMKKGLFTIQNGWKPRVLSLFTINKTYVTMISNLGLSEFQ